MTSHALVNGAEQPAGEAASSLARHGGRNGVGPRRGPALHDRRQAGHPPHPSRRDLPLLHAPNGRRITSAEELARIRSLVIPPAWEDVWICPDPRGHLQATGRDARGRKQYRYHPKWREVRDETKYDRMIGFAQALPQIRERTDRDLQKRRRAAREGARHRRAAAREDVDPRRQRRVREAESIVRPDDAA